MNTSGTKNRISKPKNIKLSNYNIAYKTEEDVELNLELNAWRRLGLEAIAKMGL